MCTEARIDFSRLRLQAEREIFSSPAPQFGQWAHDQVRGSITPRCLELELDLSRIVELHPLVR